MWTTIGRVLAGGLVAVVTSFVASFWLAEHALRSVDAQMADVVANANPTIDNMAAARAELRRVGMRQHAFVAARLAGGVGAPHDRRALDEARHELHERVRAESLIPQFPGEAELARRLDAAFEGVDAASERVIDDVNSGRIAAARRDLDVGFASAVNRADEAIGEIVQLNSRYRNERLLAIERAHARATRLGFALGLLSVLLSLATTMAAMVMLRRMERLVLERSALLADRASEMEAFAHRVAHDLRNPLSAIALRIVAAEAQEQPPAVKLLLARLRDRVRHMVDISEGLLDFAQAGRAPTGGSADVDTVVTDVICDVQPAASAAEVSLRIAESCDGQVACSPGVLSSLTSNLVNNAIKFLRSVSRPARWVEIRALRRGRCLRLEVEDNGPGIPPDVQARLFQPFSRADSAQPGIGLGLATVRRLATAHGGSAGMRSTPGQGSCFWFELPLADDQGPSRRASSEASTT